jgi:hypothetical protein
MRLVDHPRNQRSATTDEYTAAWGDRVTESDLAETAGHELSRDRVDRMEGGGRAVEQSEKSTGN